MADLEKIAGIPGRGKIIDKYEVDEYSVRDRSVGWKDLLICIAMCFRKLTTGRRAWKRHGRCCRQHTTKGSAISSRHPIIIPQRPEATAHPPQTAASGAERGGEDQRKAQDIPGK